MYNENDDEALYGIALEIALKLFSQCHSMDEISKVCDTVKDILKEGYKKRTN